MYQKSNICAACGATFTYTNASKGGSLRNHCSKECKKQLRYKARESFLKTEKGKRLLKNRNLVDKYGVSLDWYETQLGIQGGVCAICGSSDPGFSRNTFCVDHDHKTGNPRGLLCGPCNVGLGHLRDSTDILHSCINYLKTYE